MFRSIFSGRLSLAIAFFSLAPLASFAAAPAFNNITAGDYDSIVKELSADFAYSSVTPASSLGSTWGFELGPVAGITKTPEIQALVKQADPTTSFKDILPHGAILGRVGVPYGITGELMYFPKITFSGASLKQIGGSLGWTFSDILLEDFPVAMQVKAFYSRTSLDYTQTVSNYSTANIPVKAGINFTDKLYGAQFLVSKKFFVFEPYLGLGYVKANGTLSVSGTGSVTIFNQTFSQSVGQSASSKPSSVQLLAGLDVKLWILALGAEYQRAYAKNSYTARISFRF